MSRESLIANANGFTLIELLVVVAIIALLTAVLLPSLHTAKKRTRAVVCGAHLKQWGTTLALYLEDHEGRFERSLDVLPGLSLLRGLYINRRTDPNASRRYHAVETRDISCCPMATKTTGAKSLTAMTSGQVYLEMSSGGTFLAWEIMRPAPAFRGSYGLNRNFFSASMSFGSSAGSRDGEMDVFSLSGCDNIPALLDAASPNCWMVTERESPPESEPIGSAPGPVGALYNRDLCINRHDGTMNTLFLDWSVRPVGLKELWTLKWHGRFNTAGPWTKAGGAKPEDWPKWMQKFRDY